MKQYLALSIAYLTLLLGGCTYIAPAKPESTHFGPRAERAASPASLNCIQNNGKLEIIQTPSGEKGYCLLPDGKRCDEWEMFRGNCPTRTVNANLKNFSLF